MSEITTVTLQNRKAIVIKDSVGMFKLSSVMGPAYSKIQEVSQFEGISIEEIPFTSYVVNNWEKTTQMGIFGSILSMLTKKWQIEMGFIINGEATLDHVDDIDVIDFPGGTYLETVHTGPYRKVGETYKKIYAYAIENSLTMDNKSYEFYLNDPSETEEENLQTRVLVPLK